MAALSPDVSESCRQQLLHKARVMSNVIDDALGRRDAMLQPAEAAQYVVMEQPPTVAESAAESLARLRFSNQVILTLALRAPLDAGLLLGQLFDEQV